VGASTILVMPKPEASVDASINTGTL
jgi:hypothetical protein